MKHTKLVILVLLVVLSSLLVVSPVWASNGDPHPCDSGQTFGQHHAAMAQEGMLGADMNPGMHQGFSECIP